MSENTDHALKHCYIFETTVICWIRRSEEASVSRLCVGFCQTDKFFLKVDMRRKLKRDTLDESSNERNNHGQDRRMRKG